MYAPNKINSNILNQNEYFKYVENEQRKEMICKIKNHFEKVDQDIKNSRKRKEEGWWVKDTRERTIITEYGSIKFNRTRYKNIYNGEVRCLSDPSLEILKYERISISLKTKILSLVGDGSRYKDILNAIPNANITEMTISNVIKKIDLKFLKNYNYEKVNNKDDNNIYISTDDTFPSFMMKINQNPSYQKIKHRIRMVTIYTGKDIVNGRGILKNKRHFMLNVSQGQIINSKLFYEQVVIFLIKHYKYVDGKNIIVSGDGATWIKKLNKNINGNYLADKFHIIKVLKTLFPFKNKSIEEVDGMNKSEVNKMHFSNCMVALGKFDVNAIVEYLKMVAEKSNKNNFDINYGFTFDQEKVLKVMRYIKTNKIGIENWNKDWNIGCHAEAQMSIIKSMMGYGKKIYSKIVFNNLLEIRFSKINGLDFDKLWINQIEEEMGKNYENIWSYQITLPKINIWMDKNKYQTSDSGLKRNLYNGIGTGEIIMKDGPRTPNLYDWVNKIK